MSSTGPPRIAQWVAARVLPRQFRDAVLGDWSEGFADALERHGNIWATFWYWRQLLSADLVRLRFVARRVPARAPRTANSNPSQRDGTMFTGLWQDTRVAVRALKRDRVFAITVVLVLGLGIGVSSAIFGVINGVLLKPLPYHDPDALLAIWGVRLEEDLDRAPLSPWDVVHLRENASTLSDVGVFFQQSAALQSEGPATEVGFGWMTANVLPIMGITPMLGRGFTEDDRGKLVVLLDYGIWRTQFGADSSVIGRTIRLAQQEWSVIGVLPPDAPVQLPNRSYLPQRTDIWSFMFISNQNPNSTFGWARLVARLAPGATLERARDELHTLALRSHEIFPERRDFGFDLEVSKLLDDFTAKASDYLLLLTGAAALMLVIVYVNVANLMLLRGATRSHLTAVRLVLGANRWRLVQLVLIEGVVLATVGLGVGVAIATGITEWLHVAQPPGLPRVENVTMNGTVLAFAALLAVVATITFGIVPGLRMSRRNLEGVLRQRSSGPRQARSVRTLVVAEVAMSVILLVAAGLLLRTMSAVNRVHPGFEPENVLTFRIALPNQGMTNQEVAGVLQTFEERVRALPGVHAVGAVHALPLSGSLATGPFARSVGELPDGDDGFQADYRYATPEYLASMGAALVAGRHLEDTDPQSAAVVDDAFAAALWPGEQAVGKPFAANPLSRGPQLFDVVGVTRHLRHESVRHGGRPTVFFSARYFTPLYFTATVRTSQPPEQLVAPIRRLVPEVHADISMARIKSMTQWVSESSAATRWSMWVMTLFAGTAVLLAAIGLYGVLGHLVTRRSREIGIRMALGAQRSNVVLLVIRSGVVLTGVGLIVGLIGAGWLSGTLDRFLFGVSRIDPVSYAAGAIVLTAVALLASWIPAQRAVRVSPLVALKED